MASISGTETKDEISVRSSLFKHGFRFRKNVKTLSGKPDIVLPKYATLIFVHGCFWHRHEGCPYATTPSSRAEFWAGKFTQNVSRDAGNVRALEAAGWTVLTMWECQSRDPMLLDELFWRIVSKAPVA